MSNTAPRLQPPTVTKPGLDESLIPQVAINGMREQSISRLWLLWNQRRFLGRAVLAGLLVGIAVAFLLPKKFESTTRLMPPDNESSTGLALMAALSAQTGNGLSGLAGDLLGLKSSGALFVGILRSRTVEDQLIDQFDLKKVYSTKLEQTARMKLEENTYISEDRKSGILTITVTDGDPRRAAAMAQSYVHELDRLVAKVSTSSARREREFLEERLKAVQVDLENAEKDFSEFASKNRAIDIKEQGKAMVEAAATLEGQLIAAKAELEGLKRIYTEKNVRVRATQARVDEIQHQLERVGGKGESSSLAGNPEGDSLYPSLRKLPLLGVTFADLYRRTRVQEAVFEALTQQYELAKVQEAKETPSVKVLDDAVIPEKKSFPPRLLVIGLCTFFALVLAGVVILTRARWTEIGADDPGKVLAKEVFHSVNTYMPWAPPNGSRFQGITHRVWVRLGSNGSSSKTEDTLEK